MLKSTAARPYYEFLFDDGPEKIARWVMNSLRGFEIDETWWCEMFRWTYRRDIKAVVEEYTSRIERQEREHFITVVRS